MKIVKKVAVAQVCNLPKSFFKSVTKETPIMRVAGIVRAYDVVPSPYGEAFKLKGEFRALDLTQEAPETVAGSVCYLPSPLDEMIVSALRENEGKALEFAYDIAVVPDEKSNVGYQYRLRTLQETAPSDPMAALLNRVSETPLPALTMAEQVKDAAASGKDKEGEKVEAETAKVDAGATSGKAETHSKKGDKK